jgi:hypothetical protein
LVEKYLPTFKKVEFEENINAFEQGTGKRKPLATIKIGNDDFNIYAVGENKDFVMDPKFIEWLRGVTAASKPVVKTNNAPDDDDLEDDASPSAKVETKTTETTEQHKVSPDDIKKSLMEKGGIIVGVELVNNGDYLAWRYTSAAFDGSMKPSKMYVFEVVLASTAVLSEDAKKNKANAEEISAFLLKSEESSKSALPSQDENNQQKNVLQSTYENRPPVRQ